MLGVLLRRQGWPVAYLGQNVPFADLAAFLEQVRPAALVLVGMLEEPARLTGRLAEMDQADLAAGRWSRSPGGHSLSGRN